MERYLFIATISSIIFYALYHFFLRKESFHQFNRFYLLCSLVISLLIPFVRFSIPTGTKTTSNFSEIITYIQLPEITITAQNASIWNIAQLFTYIYIIGVVIFTLLFITKVVKISLLISQSKKNRKENYIYVEYEANNAPFSFFNYIFINSNAYNQEDKEQILLHEHIHVRQRHSWDLIFTELTGIVLWFNPIIFLYKRSIQITHEYLADHRVLQQGIEEGAYLNLLLRQLVFPNMSVQTRRATSVLGHHFNYLLTKNRFKMLKNQNFSKWAFAKVLLVLPFIALPIMLNSKILKEVLIVKENHSTNSSVIVPSIVEDDNGKKKLDKKSKNSQENLVSEEHKTDPCPHQGTPLELEEGMEITFLGTNGDTDCTFVVTINKEEDNRFELHPKDKDCVVNFGLTDDEKPLRDAEQMPEFEGGLDALYQFLRENVVYPKEARDKKIQGTVLLKFVVEKDGSIGKVEILQKADPLLDAEAVRVIKIFPKWIPGKVMGKPVPVWYSLPINFSIQ